MSALPLKADMRLSPILRNVCHQPILASAETFHASKHAAASELRTQSLILTFLDQKSARPGPFATLRRVNLEPSGLV